MKYTDRIHLRHSILVLMCSIMTVWCTKAQPVLSVEEAIALALQYNYDIRISKGDSSIAALDYSYRNAVFLPRINATAGPTWTRNNQKQGFSNGDERTGNVATTNISASVALNWTLFDGFRMFVTRDKLEAYMERGELVIREQIVNTVAQVIVNYFAIVREKQQLLAIEEQMALSQTRVDLAQRKLEIGVGARPDVLQSQVDLNAQRAAQIQQQTLILQLKESLNQLIRPAANGQPGGLMTEYEVSDSIPFEAELILEDVQSRLLTSNPSVLLAQKNIDIARLSIDELKADRWPVVQFNSAYNFGRTTNDIAINPALPISNRTNGLNYGFTATVPILNYRNTHRLIRQGELQVGLQQLALENHTSLLRLNVLQAYRDYEIQQQTLELEESNISLARENVNILLESYRLGHITYVQLREAQRSLEEANNRLIAARYNTKVAETELRRLQGGLLQ